MYKYLKGIDSKMKLDEYNEPKTIKEAIETLNDYFSLSPLDEKEYFNNSITSDIMYEYHHGLGTKIRNVWLWPKNPNIFSDLAKLFISLNIEHPDDMSGFLLRLFWYYKHEPDKSLEQHQQRLLDEIIIKDILE